jgi:hypothetical protein
MDGGEPRCDRGGARGVMGAPVSRRESLRDALLNQRSVKRVEERRGAARLETSAAEPTQRPQAEAGALTTGTGL